MASAEAIKVRVFTPAGLLWEDSASWVLIPGVSGEIGIYPLHAKYTGLLGTGILELGLPSGKAKRLVVSGGFCTFSGDTLTLLCDTVDLPDSPHRDSLIAEKGTLQQVLAADSIFDPKWKLASDKLRRIEALERLIAQ